MAAEQSSTLFYDADCGFCRVTVGVVLAWDRGRRLNPVPLRDPSAARQLADLSEQERMASWHLVEPDGSRHSGGSAFGALFEKLPRGGRLARLAQRFPGATARLYGFTAEHRDRLAGLVPPPLRRGAEKTLQRRAGERPEVEPEQAPGPFPEQPKPKERDPHHVLNNPVVDDPDPTEWPDPYETREDPRDPPDPDGMPFGEEPHPATGSVSTSEPHPSKDPEAGDRWEGPKRDKLDE